MPVLDMVPEKDHDLFMVSASLRTYRYLRIAMGGMIVVIFTAVAVEAIRHGSLLGSISQYFYSPARSAFCARPRTP